MAVAVVVVGVMESRLGALCRRAIATSCVRSVALRNKRLRMVSRGQGMSWPIPASGNGSRGDTGRGGPIDI